MDDLPETITVLGRECRHIYLSDTLDVWQSETVDGYCVEVTKLRLRTRATVLPVYEPNKSDTISIADPPLDGRCPDLWRVCFVQEEKRSGFIRGRGSTLAEAESNLRRNAHEWAAVLGAL